MSNYDIGGIRTSGMPIPSAKGTGCVRTVPGDWPDLGAAVRLDRGEVRRRTAATLSRSVPVFALAWHKFGAWDRQIPAFAIQVHSPTLLMPASPPSEAEPPAPASPVSDCRPAHAGPISLSRERLPVAHSPPDGCREQRDATRDAERPGPGSRCNGAPVGCREQQCEPRSSDSPQTRRRPRIVRGERGASRRGHIETNRAGFSGANTGPSSC